MVTFGNGSLVDLCTVLQLARFYFKSARVEVLIDTCAVEPVVTETAIGIQRELLQAEMVGLVVERAVKSLLSKFGK